MMDKLRVGVWYFALVSSAVLALVSLYVGESFLRVILSAIVGFALIYGLCMVSIAIFEKSGIDQESPYLGAVLDIAVGQEDDLSYTESGQSPATEQVPITVAGQLNQEFAEGLPSAEKQAEIVRRMGWGD